MIVKNEEDVLSRCLSSVQGLVEEMVVVDTGSTDSTKEVARKFTDRVFDFPWAEDFSQARNFSFSQATQQFCLWHRNDGGYCFPLHIDTLIGFRYNNRRFHFFLRKNDAGRILRRSRTFIYGVASVILPGFLNLPPGLIP